MAKNPLIGWRIDPKAVQYVGKDLQRPECILADRDGSLWSADARGGVMHIRADGSQELIAQKPDGHFDIARDASESLLAGTLPNGVAFARNGDILIANFGTDRLEVMTRAGETRVLLEHIDGKPLGKVNFVLRDRRDRLWITISTCTNPWSAAITPRLADGYIVLMDERGPRIVAEGFQFTNEIRLDAEERWLYVAETCAKRVTRLRVQPDGALTDREIYGPKNLGRGLIDGIAFDAVGNLWATMIFADRLLAITPAGDLLELFDDGDPVATAKFERIFASGESVPFEVLMQCGGRICPWLASVTFGGADLRKLFLGGLRATSIPWVHSPVPGLPMVHW
jgi:sugar lactone lactonase YvrE